MALLPEDTAQHLRQWLLEGQWLLAQVEEQTAPPTWVIEDRLMTRNELQKMADEIARR
jgi:hypothetical protein